MSESVGSFVDAPVLITGASGFIGGHLVRACKASGAQVFGFSRRRSSELVSGNSIVGDITNRELVLEVIDRVKPGYVFHLAADKSRYASIADFRHCLETNLMGTLNLVEACMSTVPEVKFISVGTCEEYGVNAPFSESMREAPVSAYSCSKVAVSHMLQTFHHVYRFPAVIVRPSLAYGPGQDDSMFVPALIKSLLADRRFAMSGGEQTRDFVYIDDLVEAIMLAATCLDTDGRVINVSSFEPVKILDLARTIADLVGDGARELLDVGELAYRPGETMKYFSDNSEAARLLGWKPCVNLHTGLSRTVEFYRDTMTGSDGVFASRTS
ncbi:MAG TPA: NAD-dependent epimerase/dehydratase family protein [Gammaproteobacteria bacterium]|nr:NAD-dependent epimerase/dehydratase family protein [Gammaproteobacteria bacterium]